MNKTILDQNIKNKIISLYNQVFEKNSDINYWDWRFGENPFGKLIIRFLLENNDIASSYIVHPINIEINSTLKKFSFLLNFPEKPITVNPITIKNNGLNISDI